ncbi:putative G-protein coupled receptor 141 [Pholidichthys leucotaenia]
MNNTDNTYHPVLLSIYSLVLVCGTITLSLMMYIMRSGITSTTSIAVLNLIFTHFVFLFTVPFRIYYYATDRWGMTYGWCKTVSIMIHIHMYMSFIFYVIIIVTRLLTFYHKTQRVAAFRRIHALVLSAAVWILVLVVGPCIIHFLYGKNLEGNSQEDRNGTTCFRFGQSISTAPVANYILSTLIIVIATVLTALQANVLWILHRRNNHGSTSQQEYGAQQKSMLFALIMVVCFIPYHIFRLYYLSHLDLENVNEVFLSLTTFNCLDMFTFLGRRSCSICLGNG